MPPPARGAPSPGGSRRPSPPPSPRRNSAQVIAQEIGIVAEPTLPPRRLENPAGASALEHLGDALRLRRAVAPGRSGSVPAASLRRAGQAANQLGVVGGVDFRVASGSRRPTGGSARPGAPPSEKTSSPESSATVGRPLRRAKYSALCRALASKVSPSRAGPRHGSWIQHDVVGEDHLDAGGLEHPPNLALLAGAPGGGEQLHQPSACRCAAKSSAIHRSARSRRLSS